MRETPHHTPRAPYPRSRPAARAVASRLRAYAGHFNGFGKAPSERQSARHPFLHFRTLVAGVVQPAADLDDVEEILRRRTQEIDDLVGRPGAAVEPGGEMLRRDDD